MRVTTHTSRDDVRRLTAVARAGLVDTVRAASALGVPRDAASARLSNLVRQGWLNRVRRGLYLIVPLEADPRAPAASEDPWVTAVAAFAPCYIGGWSAAEQWGLTEQLFRATLVITAAPIRKRQVRLANFEYRLHAAPRSRLGDITYVWRGNERIPISDSERTIVDGARHPRIVGGARHLASMIGAYGSEPERDDSKLVMTATKYANGAAWKRLGYLAEQVLPSPEAIIDAASAHLKAGYSKLDPAVRSKGRLARRWRLWINVSVGSGENE